MGSYHTTELLTLLLQCCKQLQNNYSLTQNATSVGLNYCGKADGLVGTRATVISSSSWQFIRRVSFLILSCYSVIIQRHAVERQARPQL